MKDERNLMDHPLRILQVVGKMDRGGLETLLMNLYRHIDLNRLQFDFLTHRKDEGAYDKEILSLGGRIYRLCPMRIGNLFQYQLELRRFFQEHASYRIVHSHLDAMSALPLFGAKNAGVPVRISHSHNTDFPKDLKYPFRVIAKKLLPRQATHYFACSFEAAYFLFSKTVLNTNNFVVLPNAISLEEFAFSQKIRACRRRELGLKEGTFVLCHIGRFTAQKNHQKLLHIFKALHEICPDSVLLLAGKGELEPETRSLCARLNLQKSVFFLGVCDEVAKLMQAADLFLLPSLYEGFPVSGVEAQAAGLPCLMSSTIKHDIALTGNVEFISLEESDSVWAQKALALRAQPRTNTYRQLMDKGFDIRQQAEFMDNFYHSVDRT